MISPTDALDAVAAAAAVLTHAVGEPGNRTIRTLSDQLDRLSRAVARAQVIVVLDPDAELDRPVPRCFAPEDASEHADDLAVLEAIAAMPVQPATVVLRARRLDDDSAEDALRAWIDGMRITATPAGRGYDIDANRLVSNIADRFLEP